MNKDATIIALASTVEAAKKAKKPALKLKGAPKTNSNGPPAWKCKKVGTTTTCPDSGKLFKWCPHHGSISTGKGIYMPEDHDHDAWALAKKAKSAAYLAKKRAASADPTTASATNKKKVAATGKLALAKSFQSALTTKMQCSDAEVKDIIDSAMKGCESDDDTELKD